MLELSPQQRQLLFEFILDGRHASRALSAPLESTLSYIMSNIDVRKSEQITEPATRDLVVSTFELLKNEYLLDNSLILQSQYLETISKARARVEQYRPDGHSGGARKVGAVRGP